MISIRSVTKRFGNTTAVDRLDLELENGATCALIGPSGCGKTTTLRMINRLITQDEGSIQIDGKDTRVVNLIQLRRSMGYVIQNVGLFPHMTVEQNIAVVPKLLKWGSKKISKRISYLLELVGLNKDFSARFPNELSGGQAQRVGVARALAADPPLLLMDEPFGAVDPLTRERLQSEFLKIQQELKKTVILVTHDIDEAVRLADSIAVINEGRLMQYADPESLLSKPANRFVRDFIGRDRALKRLVRFIVKDYVRHADSITIGQAFDPRNRSEDITWIVDKEGKLKGWLDIQAIDGTGLVSEGSISPVSRDAVISCDASLKEALSRMMGQGTRNVPVVDHNNILIGEIRLENIERVLSQDQTVLETSVKRGLHAGGGAEDSGGPRS